MKVQILVDNPNSWMVDYAKQLVDILKKKFDIKVSLIYKHEEVIEGDILCLLSCQKIFKKLKFYPKKYKITYKTNQY